MKKAKKPKKKVRQKASEFVKRRLGDVIKQLSKE